MIKLHREHFRPIDRSLNKNFKLNVHPDLTGAAHLCLGMTFISVGILQSNENVK